MGPVKIYCGRGLLNPFPDPPDPADPMECIGTTNNKCVCPGVAQRRQYLGHYYCCGKSNLDGWVQESVCRSIGWVPNYQQQSVHDAWAEVAANSAPVTVAMEGGAQLLTCPAEKPHVVDVFVGNQLQRACVPNWERVYEEVSDNPAVTFHQVERCQYPTDGSVPDPACGPTQPNTFMTGAVIPRPPADGGSGGGDGTAPGEGGESDEGLSRGAIAGISLLVIVIVAVLVYLAYRATRPKQDAGEVVQPEQGPAAFELEGNTGAFGVPFYQ